MDLRQQNKHADEIWLLMTAGEVKAATSLKVYVESILIDNTILDFLFFFGFFRPKLVERWFSNFRLQLGEKKMENKMRNELEMVNGYKCHCKPKREGILDIWLVI